jgi:iron complex transport system ATP-binding protein
MQPALETVGLAFGYPGRTIGADVELVLHPGEVVVLLGPNGCGKTTLFKTLLGLLPARGGEVRLFGRALLSLGRGQIAREMGYVPQAYAGYFPFTVFDTVLMGRTAHLGAFQSPGRRDREIAQRALEGLGIAALAEQAYTRVSGGQRQLSLIARALAQEPKVLIMDEPTASLDFGNQIRVLEQVRSLADQGLAVVLSTHHPDHAFQCADRVAVLHEGGVVRVGTPEAVITEDTLASVYGVQVDIHAVGSGTSSGGSVCVPRLGADRRT